MNEIIFKKNELLELKEIKLTEKQKLELIENKNQNLKNLGRVEFGESILKKIINKFIDSPYIDEDDIVFELSELTNIFYLYRSEINNLSDDEIIEYMKESFNEIYNGSLELLETLGLERLKNGNWIYNW